VNATALSIKYSIMPNNDKRGSVYGQKRPSEISRVFSKITDPVFWWGAQLNLKWLKVITTGSLFVGLPSQCNGITDK
jgi:hypothetical protein